MPNATILAVRRALDAQLPELVAKRSGPDGDWRVFTNPHVSIEYALSEDILKRMNESIRISLTDASKNITLRLADLKIEEVTVGGEYLDEKKIARNRNHIEMCLATIRAVYIRSTKTEPPG